MIGRLDRNFGLVLTSFEHARFERYRPCSVVGDGCGDDLFAYCDLYICTGFASALQSDARRKSVGIKVIRNAFGPFGHCDNWGGGVDYEARTIQCGFFSIRCHRNNGLMVSVGREIITLENCLKRTVVTNSSSDLFLANSNDNLRSRLTPTGNSDAFCGLIASDCGRRFRFIYKWWCLGRTAAGAGAIPART